MIIEQTGRIRLAPLAMLGGLLLALAGCADHDADDKAARATDTGARASAGMQAPAESHQPMAAPQPMEKAAVEKTSAASAAPSKAEAVQATAARAADKAAAAKSAAHTASVGKAAPAMSGSAPKASTQAKAGAQAMVEAKAKADATADATVTAKAGAAKQTQEKVKNQAKATQAAAWPAGDAAKGARLGRKCLSCHNTNTRRKVGPGLAGVFGRHVGRMPDMNYSPALAKGDWRWDEAHLAAWVCNAKEAVRKFSGDPAAKTKMPPQRICDPAKQADLIAWLKTLK